MNTNAYDLDAEKALLGGMMMSAEVIAEVDDLTPAHFSEPHNLIFSALAEVHRTGKPVLAQTVTAELSERGKLEAVGGPAYITGLTFDANASTTVTRHFAGVLREKWAKRQARVIARRLHESMDTGADVSAFDEAMVDVEKLRAQSNGSAPRRDTLPPMIDGCDLITTPPIVPDELVHGLLHKGCKMVLGGASKSCKTWTLIDLGLCIAKGADWWGFPTTKGKVLFINCEVQPAFFARRMMAVSATTPQPLEAGAFTTWHLRGHSADISKLAAPILQRCANREFVLIIFDPTYKMLGDRDENKAGDIAHLLNEFERIAVQTGAAVAFGAHFSKGNQAGKESIDRIGGSGVFARDPDTILTLTSHEEADAFTVEPILRNHAPIEPFAVRWKYPVMHRDEGLDPTKLKKSKTGRESIYSIADLLDCIGTDEWKTGELQKKAMEETGMSRATFHGLLKKATSQKKVSKSKLTDLWSAVQ